MSHNKTLRKDSKLLKGLWLIDYIKENNYRTFFAFIISIICYTIFISSFYLIIKPSMSKTAAVQYIKYLRNKEYHKAMECYINIPPGKGTGYEYIKNALMNKYDDANDIRLKGIEKLKDKGVLKILIEVRKNNKSFEEAIYMYNTDRSIYGMKKEWKVIFPFETRDIVITGDEGAVVFIDGIQCGEIKDGRLAVHHVIHGIHSFEARLGNIAKSNNINIEVREDTEVIQLKVLFHEDFKRSIDKLISDFIKGWSNYCLSQKIENIKPYVTDRLYKEFANDTDRFRGSKYVESQCVIGQGEIEAGGVNRVFYTVDEKWHLKEVITSPELVFKDNYASQLEQIQYIKSRYDIINDRGTWKIDFSEELDFKQEIKSNAV